MDTRTPLVLLVVDLLYNKLCNKIHDYNLQLIESRTTSPQQVYNKPTTNRTLYNKSATFLKTLSLLYDKYATNPQLIEHVEFGLNIHLFPFPSTPLV